MIGFLGDNVIAHERKAYVNLYWNLVPYPLKMSYILPPEERAEALISFIEALLLIDKD